MVNKLTNMLCNYIIMGNTLDQQRAAIGGVHESVEGPWQQQEVELEDGARSRGPPASSASLPPPCTQNLKEELTTTKRRNQVLLQYIPKSSLFSFHSTRNIQELRQEPREDLSRLNQQGKMKLIKILRLWKFQ